jgi:hypothetical protein
MLRSEVQARTGASALAVATTVLLSAATLLAGTYRVTTCFSRPDGVGGCGTVVYPFSLQALPALIWPSALFATLIVLAAFAWRTSSNKLAAIATTTYAALAGGATLLVAPLLSVAVVLLVLAYSLRTRRLRWAFIDLAIAISLTALAIASAYTLLFAATLWRGGWLGGIAPAMWVYVAFAAAVAIGVGCALAPRAEGERLPFARAALVAFGVCGVAGAVGLILLGGVPELKAAAVRSLVGIAAVAVPLGAAALWGVLRIQRRQALVGAFVAAIAFPICIVVLIGTLTSIAPGSISPASSIGPDLPRVPWLPGTSTLP